MGDTSAFLIEEAVIHPLPGVQQCLKHVQSAVGIRSFWYLVPKNHMKQKNHVNQPEKAQHFSFNHPVAQELLICFKPELQNHNKVRFMKMLFQIRPASHIRDIAILNGGDSLELAVIPHRLLQGKG